MTQLTKRRVLFFLPLLIATLSASGATPPNIIFVMADDMGWGQTGYRNHPVLKTPNLDAMAANGLRFERFYAGGPVCSPTRATVMTGRTPDRTGVLSHGYALRLQEKTIAQALRAAGYVTGHFGKWHLSGLKGPGVPILGSDTRNPGAFGFDEWVSVSNFYDLNPLMSRQGVFEECKGDSSEVVVAEAMKFLTKHRGGSKPIFAVVWYGSPHSPWRALANDRAAFAALEESSAEHYGELAAMDRSIGTLRQHLRELGLANNTLLVFCSDNGGLPKITPETVGGLRGFKGSVYEGGLRVPGIIEWPGLIKPRITSYPAGVMDLFPTVADILGLPDNVLIKPVDGVSLKPLFAGEIGLRSQPLGFRFQGKAALVDNRYKLVAENLTKGNFQLYDLETDPVESHDLTASQPAIAERMRTKLLAWNTSVEASFAGKDYAEGKLNQPDPEPQNWTDLAEYQKYFPEWQNRPEYQSTIKQSGKADGKVGKAGKKKKN